MHIVFHTCLLHIYHNDALPNGPQDESDSTGVVRAVTSTGVQCREGARTVRTLTKLMTFFGEPVLKFEMLSVLELALAGRKVMWWIDRMDPLGGPAHTIPARNNDTWRSYIARSLDLFQAPHVKFVNDSNNQLSSSDLALVLYKKRVILVLLHPRFRS